ncbi:restriction endonuclease subunit S [Paraferrimonas haliotis]|uniref:Restriction modification system S chain-like protein n=1 Tax=Paraferrimonas haliotis TaxID=2013866 RepID=A0AA37TP10_9GAMM|nr:restriction endonuclease subunit S [Paraferrimonas haliotis]GLS84937.1 restriction modification system S chain-like protein [Paraferrimonas haliotis]
MEPVLYSLPDGWSWRKLSELAKTTSGGTPSRSNKDYWGGSIPWVKSGELGDSRVEKNEEFITEVGLKNSSAKLFPKESLLLALYGATAGKLGVLTYDAATNQAVCCISQDDQLLARDFLRYYLLSQRKKIIEDSFGGAQPNISQAYVREIDIPTPPLTEQIRIVEKLDALLTRIDTAIEHLQSKLDLSKQLFDSVLDEFFKLSDCDSVPLTEVVDFIGGSQPPKSQFSDVQKEGYVRLIQIRDYKTDNHIVYVDSASTKKFCTKDDVMIGRYGPPVFQILRGLDGAYNVALMKAVPNEDVLTKDYLFWFLQSPSIQNYVIGISQRAAGQSGVNKKALEKYLIPVPSKAIQNDIVDKVGQLVNKSRNLEAGVTAEITSLNQLKASILDSAFKGEL